MIISLKIALKNELCIILDLVNILIILKCLKLILYSL